MSSSFKPTWPLSPPITANIVLDQYREYAPPFDCILEVKSERLQFLIWPFVYNFEIKGNASLPDWQTVGITFASIEAAQRLILALGQDAHIHKPDSLAELVRQKVAALAGHYNTPETPPTETLKA